MSTVLDMVVMAAEPTSEWAAQHVPPDLDLTPFTRAELCRWFKGGEPTADAREAPRLGFPSPGRPGPGSTSSP